MSTICGTICSRPCWTRSPTASATGPATPTSPTASSLAPTAALPTSICSWPTSRATGRPTSGLAGPIWTPSSGTRWPWSTSPSPASLPPTVPSGTTPGTSGRCPPSRAEHAQMNTTKKRVDRWSTRFFISPAPPPGSGRAPGAARRPAGYPARWPPRPSGWKNPSGPPELPGR